MIENRCMTSPLRSFTAALLCAVSAALALAGTSAARTKATTTTTTTTNACGGEVLPPKPGGGSWTCTFDDEFDPSTGDPNTLSSWWVPQVSATSGYTTGPVGDQVCYVNSPDNIAVSGGALHLTVRQESAPFSCGGMTTQYTGGMVSTWHTFSQTYGRFEARALLPSATVAGLHEALWLYPQNLTYGAWPASGEIDFSEFYSSNPSSDIPFIHYNYDPSTVNWSTSTNETSTSCPISYGKYNNYAVTWLPGKITITVNGKTCLVDNYIPDDGLVSPQPFDQPFFILLTQALGVAPDAFNPSTTPLPATLSVDYVRAWQ
jgi:beta-glucanase (GH16 family)